MLSRFLAGVAVMVMVALPVPAEAHCDGLDGPVVKAAQKALQDRDPNPVLIWVKPAAEAEVRSAFAATLEVRQLGPSARELADRHFFETVVRLHRAGEGAAYGGLKPAGQTTSPAIKLADQAVAAGSDRELVEFVANEAKRGVAEQFALLKAKRNYRTGDVAAGRDYVASYVAFIHYVERLHEAAATTAAGHFDEPAEPHADPHQ